MIHGEAGLLHPTRTYQTQKLLKDQWLDLKTTGIGEALSEDVFYKEAHHRTVTKSSSYKVMVFKSLDNTELTTN